MLFLCNPNNPTGSIICKDELIFIIKKCSENDCFVLLDESFIDFLEDDKEFSLLDKITKFKNAAVLRSLTKFYGIPGLRLGYIVANKALLTKIKNTQPDWPVNILAQIAGEKLFDDKNFANKTKKIIKREKEFIFLKLKDIKNLKPYNSYANFILIEILDSLISSGYLKKKLLENSNILIRDCQNFRELGSNYFRISIKKHKENNLLIESLIKIFGTKSLYNYLLISQITIILGFIADLIFGDPGWFPHPVKGIGHLIKKLEPFFRKKIKNERNAGILFATTIILIVFLITLLIIFVSITVNVWLFC